MDTESFMKSCNKIAINLERLNSTEAKPYIYKLKVKGRGSKVHNEKDFFLNKEEIERYSWKQNKTKRLYKV